MNHDYVRHEMDLNERLSLRQEVAQCNWMIYATTWGVILAMVIISTMADYGFLNVLLGIAWIHAMARYEFLIQRIGAYLRVTGSDWESSRQRKRGLRFLVAADIGCMAPILYIFGMEVSIMWANGMTNWALASAAFFLFGIALLVASATVHKQPL